MPSVTHVPERGTGYSGESSEHAIRAELKRVLSSTGFRKSERLARFLRFVCEQALAGEGAKLNEVLIAQEVFDRGADFSPGEDSVVRRQAYSLRQKLQDFYVHEGRNRPIRIQLPIGRYVPTFSLIQDKESAALIDDAAPNEIATDKPARAESLEKHWWRAHIRVFAVALACLIIGTSAGWLAAQHAGNKALNSAVGEIWGEWLADPQPTVICFSTPITASIQQVAKPYQAHGAVDRLAVQEGPAAAEQIRRQLNLNPGGYLYLFPGLAHAKMGETLGTIRLCSMLTKAGLAVRATESRFLNWDDFRNENIIVLGHVEANAWVHPILQRLPLQMASTTVDKPRRIVNPDPLPGERAEYFPSYPDGTSQPQEDYALISMINGIDGHHRLALVSGVNTEGTQMGLEYLSDPTCLQTLVSLLNRVSPHKEERQFQLVLHGELRDRMPMNVSLLLIRVVS